MLKRLPQIEKELGISRKTLYAMRRAGLPMVNVGAGSKRPTLAVDEEQLRAFMDRPLEHSDRKSAPVSFAVRRQWKFAPRPVKV